MNILIIVFGLAWFSDAGAVTIRLGVHHTQADIVSAIWHALPETSRAFEYGPDVIHVTNLDEPIRFEFPVGGTAAQIEALDTAITNICEERRTDEAPVAVRMEGVGVVTVKGATPSSGHAIQNDVRTGLRMVLRTDPRWSAAECALANLRQLRGLLPFTDPSAHETVVEVDDGVIDATRRADVRQHFAIRAGDPLLGGRFKFEGRTLRVIWRASRTAQYASPDREYPYHETKSGLSALIDTRLDGVVEDDEHFDFEIDPPRGVSMSRQAQIVLLRLERAGTFDRAGDVLRGDDSAIPAAKRDGLHLMFNIMVATLNEARPLHARKVIVWRSQLNGVCTKNFLN